MLYAEVVAEAIRAILLRLPLPLHAALSDWAREERRSLSAHIVYLLERAVREHAG